MSSKKKIEKLLKILHKCAKNTGDFELTHPEAAKDLIEYIGDPEVEFSIRCSLQVLRLTLEIK